MAEMRLCVAPAACTPSHQGWSRRCHCWASNLPATETFLNSHYGSIPWGDRLATEDKLTAVGPSILEGLEICSHRSRHTFGCGVLFSEPLTEDLQCACPPAWEQTLHGTRERTLQKSRCGRLLMTTRCTPGIMYRATQKLSAFQRFGRFAARAAGTPVWGHSMWDEATSSRTPVIYSCVEELRKDLYLNA